MAKVRREEVISAALELLNEVGLDELSTRRLAQRLGVESPTLYWHFHDKAALLSEMSASVMTQNFRTLIPETPKMWPEWFSQNARDFRTALLAFRDGARLHAGSKPNLIELRRLELKVEYLVRAGIPRTEALMAMLAAGQFTLGCVMEEQARQHARTSSANKDVLAFTLSAGGFAQVVDGVAAESNLAFEFGLRLLVDGLQQQNRSPQYTKQRRQVQPGQRVTERNCKHFLVE